MKLRQTFCGRGPSAWFLRGAVMVIGMASAAIASAGSEFVVELVYEFDTQESERPNQDLGASIALLGDSLLVGAPGNPANGVPNTGSAFLFDLNSGQMTREFNVPNLPGVINTLGESVALTEDYVIVGNPTDFPQGPGGTAAGPENVYVFNRHTGNLVHTLALDGFEDEQVAFGGAMSAHGSQVVVSARITGAAYLYDLDSGELVQTFSDDSIPALGRWMNFDGDRLITSTPSSAAVFDADSGELLWDLTPNEGRGFGGFATSVAIEGDYAIAGAPDADIVGNASGGAWVFDLTTGEQVHRLDAESLGAADSYGSGVTIHNGIALVGADFSRPSTVTAFDVETGEELFELRESFGQGYGENIVMNDEYIIVSAERFNANWGKVFVYRYSIPEPGTAMIALAGLAIATKRRRKQTNLEQCVPRNTASP